MARNSSTLQADNPLTNQTLARQIPNGVVNLNLYLNPPKPYASTTKRKQRRVKRVKVK